MALRRRLVPPNADPHRPGRLGGGPPLRERRDRARQAGRHRRSAHRQSRILDRDGLADPPRGRWGRLERRQRVPSSGRRRLAPDPAAGTPRAGRHRRLPRDRAVSAGLGGRHVAARPAALERRADPPNRLGLGRRHSHSVDLPAWRRGRVPRASPGRAAGRARAERLGAAGTIAGRSARGAASGGRGEHLVSGSGGLRLDRRGASGARGGYAGRADRGRLRRRHHRSASPVHSDRETVLTVSRRRAHGRAEAPLRRS